MCEVRFPFIGITIQVDPVAFRIGTFEVYWYGILIAAAMILCGWLAVRHSKSNKFSEDLVYDVLLVSLPSAIIGARLYYVFCEWEYYSQDIRRIFDTRSGGLAVYGGILGAVLGTYIMCRIRKIPFSTVLDYCIVYIPLGQAIGRWGNFFNQEAFGTTTTLPWGMTSSKISHYLETYCPDLDPSMPVHPTFLYESLCTTAIFLVLLLAVRPNSQRRFETASVYMVLYGIARFFIEGLRTDSLYLGSSNIRTSQLLSLILVFGGLALILVSHLKEWEIIPLPENAFARREEKNKSKK
ncbi:MAG: prolipoprotein diacylglyceryl transferase [Clostridiales bacterium]|nr:prolipoprotein diacylglyceryl transferase [Clostridiales bacterium]